MNNLDIRFTFVQLVLHVQREAYSDFLFDVSVCHHTGYNFHTSAYVFLKRCSVTGPL